MTSLLTAMRSRWGYQPALDPPLISITLSSSARLHVSAAAGELTRTLQAIRPGE